jgi:hypothetical protein
LNAGVGDLFSGVLNSRKPDRAENVTIGWPCEHAMKTPRFGSMQAA